jgi:hypothetical protein
VMKYQSLIRRGSYGYESGLSESVRSASIGSDVWEEVNNRCRGRQLRRPKRKKSMSRALWVRIGDSGQLRSTEGGRR